jgi:hypothetical protein
MCSKDQHYRVDVEVLASLSQLELFAAVLGRTAVVPMQVCAMTLFVDAHHCLCSRLAKREEVLRCCQDGWMLTCLVRLQLIDLDLNSCWLLTCAVVC